MTLNLNMLYNLVTFREVFRYQAVLMRQRFEENRDIKDMRIARQLLENGEEEVFQKRHYQPKKCAIID